MKFSALALNENIMLSEREGGSQFKDVFDESKR